MDSRQRPSMVLISTTPYSKRSLTVCPLIDSALLTCLGSQNTRTFSQPHSDTDTDTDTHRHMHWCTAAVTYLERRHEQEQQLWPTRGA